MRSSPRAIAAAVTLTLALARTLDAECPTRNAPEPREALPNDNRVAAGAARGDTLFVRLEARPATWRPDGAAGCALQVNAFAEEGKAASIPGPLLRVRSGMQIVITVRNALAKPLWLRGLQDRPAGPLDSVEIFPDSTRAFRFRATAPGAWYYWAGAESASQFPRSNEDGQLVGALVVDDGKRPDARDSARRTQERVMVMTRWTPTGATGVEGFQLNAINGRSWPATERLQYDVGDSLHWHVINASDELHMMHLHGFYFRIDSRGDATHDSLLTRERPPTRVTTAVRRGEWISISWSPDRAGNWLFHCHLLAHMSGDQRLTNLVASHDTAGHHPPTTITHDHMDAMGGLVMGITVRPARSKVASTRSGASVASPAVRRRSFDLFVDRRERVYGDRPGYGFVVQQGNQRPATDSIRIPGSTLVLTRGEPVEITVHNRLPTPMGVHWHGIELESYYDGVAGWSGNASRVAPMTAPGGTFVVRFTPPRAGTFIYHVHSERGEELASGLYGPLIVLEPGTTFDERRDHTFVIAADGPTVKHRVAVNGTATPDTVTLTAGERHRIRLIDISANDVHLVSLRDATGTVTWALLANDGWIASPADQVPRPARTVTSAGITQDFEITPTVPDAVYSLVITQAISAGATPTGQVTTVPLRVRAP